MGFTSVQDRRDTAPVAEPGAVSSPLPARSAVYLGRVMHRRLRPFRHRFDYRVFSLYLDLDELDGLAARLRLFSRNRTNLVSFHDADHGPRDGTALRPWIGRALDAIGLSDDGGPIRLLCFPRILGYVFNPLSLYYCYDRAERLRAVVYEVCNTFGQSHAYAVPVPADHSPGAPIVQSQDKKFYVSPFIGMAATYRFRLTEPADRLSVLIRQSVPEGELLVATLTGERVPLTDGRLLRAWLGDPAMTWKVMGAIHWQALRLWRKGAVFHRRPAPPEQPFSH